ncbi:MAG: hypothetical protein ACFB02_08680 [Mastigocoleus sp.]
MSISSTLRECVEVINIFVAMLLDYSFTDYFLLAQNDWRVAICLDDLFAKAFTPPF